VRAAARQLAKLNTNTRYITDHMAATLGQADFLGESERGRPLYRIKVREAVAA
jgi:hypothetical protein